MKKDNNKTDLKTRIIAAVLAGIMFFAVVAGMIMYFVA
jgi:hypothetical protein